MQRDEAAKRAEQGIEWHPKLFRKIDAGGRDREGEEGLDWILDADIDGRSPAEQSRLILSIAPILPDQQQHQLQQRQHQNEYQQQYQQPQQEPQRQPQQQPSQPSSQPSYSQQQQQQQQQTTHPYSRPQGSNDLVDFGQNDGVNSSSSSHIGFMGQTPWESKDIEHPNNGGGQFGIGLQQPMQPSGYQLERSVRRQDSDDGRVEEFMEAES
ncbi:Oxysterol-binding protein OBPa [Cryomyces antarcticus]|nr:Oxysterol-binding protein OBPa [Cryomyces antarcticus]